MADRCRAMAVVTTEDRLLAMTAALMDGPCQRTGAVTALQHRLMEDRELHRREDLMGKDARPPDSVAVVREVVVGEEGIAGAVKRGFGGLILMAFVTDGGQVGGIHRQGNGPRG